MPHVFYVKYCIQRCYICLGSLIVLGCLPLFNPLQFISQRYTLNEQSVFKIGLNFQLASFSAKFK